MANSNKTTTLVKSVTNAVGTCTYTYDLVGNIKTISDGTYTTSYDYDALNQLVRENNQKENYTKTSKTFYNNVRNKGQWDYKLKAEYKGVFKFNDLTIEGQDIGNINFGYTGKALGIPDSILLKGAGLAQIKAGTSKLSFLLASNGDDMRDQIYIMYGIMLYKEDNE
ncbi:MAG: polymorphic toxin type 44 domain-containing protein [Oscillospiraceae bacterium]